MSQHTHTTFVPGCFRCDLGRDEAEFARQEEERDIAMLRERLAHWDGTTTSFDELLDRYGITREQLDAIPGETSE